jgi:abortive infection bacteriophage resistance protein
MTDKALSSFLFGDVLPQALFKRVTLQTAGISLKKRIFISILLLLYMQVTTRGQLIFSWKIITLLQKWKFKRVEWVV